MKKIYIGLLVLNSIISFTAEAKSNFLNVNDTYETIEYSSFQTIIGREAGTIGEIDKDLFKSAHQSIVKFDAINDTNSILHKLDTDTRLLYTQFIDNSKVVEQTDVAALYKFDNIHLNQRDEPITADDIIKVNKEFDRIKLDNKSKTKSLFENLFSNTFSNKTKINKENAIKNAENVTFSYKEVNSKKEKYNSNVIEHIDNYNQKEVLNKINSKNLFGKTV